MLPALDLARRVEAGELTPEGLVDLCAAAISAREDDVGAFTYLAIEKARAFARTDAARLRALPLRGLPVGLKDIYDTHDMPTEYGSAAYRGHQPASDASTVTMLRRAGGNILGKTVTTEFAHQQTGKTRNPHNLAHTPGGSSSGSAAAVAAGMVPIATGSQTAGSVIRPAAYCGVAGFKPSYKLIPTIGVKCYAWSLDTVGFYGAGVADVAFATAAMSGRDLRVDRAAPTAPRVALMHTHIWADASPDMQNAVDTAARDLEAAGASVTEVALPPLLQDAWRAHKVIILYEAGLSYAFEYDNKRDLLGPKTVAMLDEAKTVGVDAYDDARRIAKRARLALAHLMADFDVILTPSAPGAAPHGIGATGVANFNWLWTLMGTPCVNVPGLSDGAGMPLGVQIVGRFGRDRAALEAALFTERALASRT
ncbi:MAG: amidase [Alphaproteobacteria bacterium]|nr:MAG: amidase [Alphaproteobacteria bacterium]